LWNFADAQLLIDIHPPTFHSLHTRKLFVNNIEICNQSMNERINYLSEG